MEKLTSVLFYSFSEPKPLRTSKGALRDVPVPYEEVGRHIAPAVAPGAQRTWTVQLVADAPLQAAGARAEGTLHGVEMHHRLASSDRHWMVVKVCVQSRRALSHCGTHAPQCDSFMPHTALHVSGNCPHCDLLPQ